MKANRWAGVPARRGRQAALANAPAVEQSLKIPVERASLPAPRPRLRALRPTANLPVIPRDEGSHGRDRERWG